jgi:hypothetical protein
LFYLDTKWNYGNDGDTFSINNGYDEMHSALSLCVLKRTMYVSAVCSADAGGVIPSFLGFEVAVILIGRRG